MSAIQYYGAEEVRKVLTWKMVNGAINEAFKAVSATEHSQSSPFACQPPRTITMCGGNRSKLLFSMPAFVGNYQLADVPQPINTLACKLVTGYSGNAQRQPPLPNILANIVLFDTETGRMDSIVEATQITAWRTASASIVATKYLYFERGNEHDSAKPINLAIIGCGVQGESHAFGMCATYNVSNVYLWNRTTSRAEALAAALRAQYPKVNVVVSVDTAAAVAEADVICIGTFSSNALISYEMLKKCAVHINTVGAGEVHFGEVSQDIYDCATVYVDSWSSAETELKGLKATIVAEVGEIIINGERPNKDGITIFQSMGMAAEDATVAQAVMTAIKACEGTENAAN